MGEIGLLAAIAMGVIILMALNGYASIEKGQNFDASAYLVVLTLIVSTVRDRWTQRSVDRMGDQLGQSVPGRGGDPLPVEVVTKDTGPVEVVTPSDTVDPASPRKLE